MIITSAPQNEAILSNVGEIGEFRIRNSAKAFNILSSGLYANKIRAIIRELSCNAVDSHVAAGRSDTAFDVHLPTVLEPWFAIRDYGTGLTHDQVTNIYTTYFESTKSDSNDYIGALGLGSKSPFSYTENFTVTTVKDGRRGIYSAFINESGVPSIALMSEDQSDEPAGVEVKFSVNDRWDFDKFIQESKVVYRYFALKPVVSGPEFSFDTIIYETENIVPGVHKITGRNPRSVAVMGNIAYPIEIPNAESNLGDLRHLLDHGLEIRFEIGDLDFQASREGLSYIPQTIESIRARLQQVNDALTDVLAKEADAIGNLWERAAFLEERHRGGFWKTACLQYVKTTQFPLLNDDSMLTRKRFTFTVEDLAKKFNIAVTGFTKERGTISCSNLKPDVSNSATDRVYSWEFSPRLCEFFVFNDTRIGAVERAKFHWRTTGVIDVPGYWSNNVYVLTAVDKTMPIREKAFLKALLNPPAKQVKHASELHEKTRQSGGMGQNITIMRLEERGRGGYHTSREMVWRDAGPANSFGDSETYYYLPLSGFAVESTGPTIGDVKAFYESVRNAGIGLYNLNLYGVRKADHKWVKAQKNWINIQDHLKEYFGKLSVDDIRKIFIPEIDKGGVFSYNKNIVELVKRSDSPYLAHINRLRDVEKHTMNISQFKRLCNAYNSALTIETIHSQVISEFATLKSRYPLLESIGSYNFVSSAVAEYINLIDEVK